ncbi:MAG TPA: type II toxin-antitoxin system HicA family toxin [Methylomirabilota bacterium]|nr:type II toxin-antitoxin system HicA family toxin [Methylomirabilota bacterium]
MTRRQLSRWLVDHGFEELPGRATGHRQFVRDGVKVTLPGHGPQDLTKKHLGMLLRQLEAAGFDREAVKRELGIG